MKAPVKYYGGKGTMFNEILRHFPPAESYRTYIEPFGGSYVVGLNMPYIPPVEIYNDLEKNVYSLYKVLSDGSLFGEFKSRCDLAFYSADLRKEYQRLLKNPGLSLADRAFYYFYVNRTSHNGIGGFCINSAVRRNMSKSVSDMLSTVDGLALVHDRLSRLICTDMDGVTLIRRFSLRSDVFMYCDPPYEQSTRTAARYKVDMNTLSQKEFIKAASESKAKLLISGYDCEVYDELTEHNFTKFQFLVKTTCNNGKPKTKIETL